MNYYLFKKQFVNCRANKNKRFKIVFFSPFCTFLFFFWVKYFWEISDRRNSKVRPWKPVLGVRLLCNKTAYVPDMDPTCLAVHWIDNENKHPSTRNIIWLLVAENVHVCSLVRSEFYLLLIKNKYQITEALSTGEIYLSL